MKWGISLLNTQDISSQCPPQSYQPPKHPRSIVFYLGIVFNTHSRLTINVAQFTVVSESRNKSYNANVLWVSLSRLIPHVMDPQSTGKAVQGNKYATNAILKYNTLLKKIKGTLK